VSSSSAPSVFVVDDEPVIASTLAAVLRMHGYSTKFFTSPLAALAAAKARSPDLLISEAVIPGVSGVDLAILMKTWFPACKVLLFSGAPSSLGLLDSARIEGHNFDLLLKPVPIAELLAEISKRVGSAGEDCIADRRRCQRCFMDRQNSRAHSLRQNRLSFQ
jgi:DNA-binding NtrC family response regulator